MAATALLLPISVPAPEARSQDGDFDARLKAGLSRLRLLALRCRAAPRLDLFSACALLSSVPDEASHAFATALLRSLPRALGRDLVFHNPGSREISFDEAWVLRLLQAAGEGKEDWTSFLISSRISRPYRRQIAWLARGLSEGLDAI